MKELKHAVLPPSPHDLPVDPNHLAKCQVAGLFEQPCNLDGVSRIILTYLPEMAENNDRCIIVVPPSHVSPEEFLISSGLYEFADRNRCILGMLVPENGHWNLDGRDADYANAAYKKMQSREWFVVMQDCIYLFGFGDGATIAQQAAMKMTSEWSGLATFGSFQEGVMLNAGDCKDEDTGNQEGEMYIASEKAQLPVWMCFSSPSVLDEQVIAYWKSENNNRPEPLYDQRGTEIWMPPLLQKTSRTNNEAIAQTRISTDKEEVNVELLDEVWAYVGAARRHRGYGGKILRYFRDPIHNGATYHTLEVDGFLREWYEYVPDHLKESTRPVPLVVCLHGRGGNGETFFDISDMCLVAEERGFIALFPTADFYEFKKTGLRTLRLWQGDYNGKKLDSIPFIRSMIEDVKGRWCIDDGRIYACGQSSGGYMSTYLAMAASDLFTAVAPWSAFVYPGIEHSDFHYFHEDAFESGNIPILLIFGDKDDLIGAKSLSPLPAQSLSITGFIQYCQKRFDLKEEPSVYECLPITYYVWQNSKGTPMLKVGIVQNMPHANYPEESRISYDEFLCKFEKRNGKLLYMGRPAE